tara:strand:- start:1337 stop:2584 length:1248 start_codon:yes stop_codon:yes gene_type:complete
MVNPYTGKTIFVQIAAYRDPELEPTLDDMFDKATEPDNIHVCICWQHTEEDEWDTLAKYQDDVRVTIIDIAANDSKGVCWARNLIQQEYKGEDFTLQLDSHHRFIDGWDTELKNEIMTLQIQGYEKPLLTGYISAYHPSWDEKDWVKEPWGMVFDRFTPDGVVFFAPQPIPNWQELTAPIPARFYSAHFCFTLGSFCTEVQHDPEYYFHGEEIAIAVRAYTHGYDLFHPHKIVAYHEFSRDYRPDKHWDSYDKWTEHNLQTFSLMRQLLGIDGEASKEIREGQYGLGTERTISDWESYAGVQFANRLVKQDTLDNKIPSNSDGEWLKHFKHFVDLPSINAPEDDYDFFALALHDKDGSSIYRRDVDTNEINDLKSNAMMNIKFECLLEGDVIPYEWIVWPHSISKGWCDRQTGLL